MQPEGCCETVFEVINKMSNENQNLNKTADAIPHANEPEAAPTPQAALTIVPPATDENTDENINAVGVEAGHEPTEVQPVSMQPAIDLNEAKRGLEAALLAASEPMPLQELKKIFEGELNADILRNLLDELRAEWAERSVELAIVASGYRFRVKPDYQKYIDRLANEKPPKYSRAVLETMAIIAYRQPVTRSDIEDIRGVAVSPHILKTLEDRGWIDEIGHKDAPGRPALFATTKHFLDDLNLLTLDELPALHELQATLDMSQAGAALHAGAERGDETTRDETLALPGVAQVEAGIPVSAEEKNSTTQNIDADEDTRNKNTRNENASNESAGQDENETPESAGEEHENHRQEPGATS